MRFLVLALPKHPVPMEMVMPALEMFKKWLAQYETSGKIEQAWNFAGLGGGGGLLKVDSHEELDRILAEYPWAFVSEMQVYALSDLNESIDYNIDWFRQMAAMMQPKG